MSALALQILVVITFARTPPAEARDRNEQAAAAIETANAARAAGDIAAALEHYQRALELRPAAALHYNIAVCHHMLMSRAADSDPARERSRVAAIESYNRYLEERPEASDRVAVEKAILTLGGKPTSKPPFTVRRIRSNGSNGPRSTSAPTEEPSSAVEREAIGSQQARHSTGDNDDRSASAPTGALIERPPPAKEPPSPYSRGLFSVEAEVATLHPAPLGGSRLAAAPMLGPAITVGGLLGERKRVLLGAETAFSVQPAASSSKLTVSLWRLGFLSMVRFPLGSKRATIIAVGGQFGVGLESLHSSADPPLVQ
jgi:tetratricopeptide (TPR) repeat protein